MALSHYNIGGYTIVQKWHNVDVLTVDSAKESCPVYSGHANRLHRNFEDLAARGGPENERMAVFRRVRDQLRDYLRRFPPARLNLSVRGSPRLGEERPVGADSAAIFIRQSTNQRHWSKILQSHGRQNGRSHRNRTCNKILSA